MSIFKNKTLGKGFFGWNIHYTSLIKMIPKIFQWLSCIYVRNINEPFNDLLTNKLVFSEIVGKVLKVPKTYGWIFNGIYYPKDELNIENLLLINKKIVIKAVNGGGGKDVFIINKESDNNFIINILKISERRTTKIHI